MSDIGTSDTLPPGGEDPRQGVSPAVIARIVVGIVVILAIATSAWLSFSAGQQKALAPAPERALIVSQAAAQADVEALTVAPDQLQALAPADARAWNAALPFATERTRPAPPFFSPVTSPADYGRALDCLTAAVYYEAANETPAGKLAVAQVVLNRVRHPVYPKTVCGVVFEGSQRATGCQFTFTCDGALARAPSAAGWASARAVAQSALNGMVLATVGAATHYHADYVAPYWAARLSKLSQIGAHIFYRFPGRWSDASALANRYKGGEPVIGKMAALTTPVEDPLLDVGLPAITPQALHIETGAIDPAGAAPLTPQGAPAPIQTAPVGATPAAPPPPAPVVRTPENPLTTPMQPARNRIARPGSW